MLIYIIKDLPKISFPCRLNLPGSIVEDGRETAEYEAETGNIVSDF